MPRASRFAVSRGLRCLRLLPSYRRLPLLEEFQPLRLVEPGEQIGGYRDRLDRAAQLLRESHARILAGDVGAHRKQLRLLGGDRLPALGEEIVDPQAPGVRV